MSGDGATGRDDGRGGKGAASVGAKTDVLDEGRGGGEKLKKAESRGSEVVDEAGWAAIVAEADSGAGD